VRTPGRPGRAAAPEAGTRHSAIAAPLSAGWTINYIVQGLQRGNAMLTTSSSHAK
jgi:hypothetical protein